MPPPKADQMAVEMMLVVAIPIVYTQSLVGPTNEGLELCRCSPTRYPSLYIPRLNYSPGTFNPPLTRKVLTNAKLAQISTTERIGETLYSVGYEMIDLDTIREANRQGKSLSGLVCVFIGGTGGIGESTAKEVFLQTTKPKAYIVGRNATRGSEVVQALKSTNPEGEAYFLQKNIDLFQNVDEVCAEIKRRELKINCLFLTAGYMTVNGRDETSDGLDRKMVVNYYSRMRFIMNLMPELTAASEAGELSRVLTVLAAGSEGEVHPDDLDLKNNFSLHNCLAHCVVMSDFMVDELSSRYPGTSFSHSYPGTVKTGIVNQLTGSVRLAVKVMYAVMSPWIINVADSGERHFFQISNLRYPAAKGGVGLPIPEGLSVARGTNGKPGSGAYLLDWDGQTTGDEAVLEKYREMGMGPKIWDHTMEIFTRAEQRREAEKTKNKRRASSDADGSDDRSMPNPPGWRAA
ncbi:Hypothetical protein R9X50_00672900 [Acrodontium crateriforme]|uniref:Uncharacterized protein n=1 Tax=Acrodontium crateriforme TaxID=150365 RepID=A0AAQ3R706_9PEZI|nr:Hypothetical protein R9X50_00672900 [Acrodontium crateriforme]